MIGSHALRTKFLEKISEPHDTSARVRIFKAHGERRRDCVSWKSPLEVYSRPESTVILEGSILESIMKRVQHFIDTKRECLEVGLPLQLGVAFLGPPGTGKSSLVKVIAQHFNFPIYNFAIGDSTLTDSRLMAMCDDMEPNSIALFEDIDKTKIGEKGITESGLLNALDGVGTRCEGRLLILTANNREDIAEAVMRKGRIDEEYSFSLATKAQAKKLFLRNNLWTAQQKEGLELEDIAKQFAEKVPDRKIPPANIAAYLKGGKGPNEAVKNISTLVK